MRIAFRLLFVLFNFGVIFFISCRREQDITENKNVNSIEEKIFTVPANATSAAKAIAARIKRENDKTHFVEKFVKRVGYPRWNKTLEYKMGSRSPSGRSQADDSTVVYIPFVRENENFTNASLIVKLAPEDTAYRMIYDRQYPRFGFDTTGTGWKAKNIFHIFSRLDNLFFGYKEFLIKDGRIFGYDQDKKLRVKLPDNNIPTGRTTTDYIEVCQTYTIEENCSSDFARTADCETRTETVCTIYWYTSGGGGGSSSGSGDSGTGGGSSGGGTGGNWYDDPCNYVTNPGQRTADYTDPCADNSGWQPVEEIMANPDGSYNIDENNNSIGGYDNTLYPQFDIIYQTWPTIDNVIPKSDFVPLPSPYSNCLTLAKQQIAKKNYQISDYWAPDQTIQIYTTANGADINNAKSAVSYLIYALQNEIPVIVGIDNRPGSPNPQTDNSTDLFVAIVGIGTDSQGNFFRFYDNATNLSSKGTHDENKLYYNSTTGIITGKSQTGYATSRPDMHDYIVTHVRKSKPL